MIHSISKIFLFTAIVTILSGCLSFGSDSLPDLHLAAANSDFNYVNNWVKNGFDIDYEYNDRSFRIHGGGSAVRKQTALMLAAENGNYEMVKLLVEAGANRYAESNRADGGGVKSVFDYAVQGGDYRTIVYLWENSDKQRLEKHLAYNYRKLLEHTCVTLGDTKNQSQLLSFLLFRIDRKFAPEALSAIAGFERCDKTTQQILKHGITSSANALIHAARLGNTETVALYLEQGADINGRGSKSSSSSRNQVTPLIAAAGRKNLDTVRYLLERGADPHLRDGNGRTPLIAAVSENYCSAFLEVCEEHLEVIKLLLEYGVQVDVRDKYNKSALDYVDRVKNSDVYADRKRELLISIQNDPKENGKK